MLKLKYGMNPQQEYAELVDDRSAMEVLGGQPSFINLLDALNAWQLVREAAAFAPAPVAASFKHVSPSGVAIGRELSDRERAAYFVTDRELSPLASAYAMARGSDRLASFGDFVALSRTCDVQTARVLRSEVSDGVIAPDYESKAVEILRKKKNGRYLILKIDPSYVPEPVEEREVFGFRLRQDRNQTSIGPDMFVEPVARPGGEGDDTGGRPAGKPAGDVATLLDLALGLVTLKYTQSNSICVVADGQVIGVGAGQQSRVLCTRLALAKANRWFQKLVMTGALPALPAKATRTEKDQLIEASRESRLGEEMKLPELGRLSLCSDAYFPHPDNIEVAAAASVTDIAAPLGSVRDDDILDACARAGITFHNSGVRLFHHG
jgi:AICAR transformylase/IMP cyclohydrolase PurH